MMEKDDSMTNLVDIETDIRPRSFDVSGLMADLYEMEGWSNGSLPSGQFS